MLSYENRPHVLSDGYPSYNQNIMTNSMDAAVDGHSGDHMSNGVSHQPTNQHRHIWLITGPAGCGKSTVGEYIANSLNLPFLEGDNFHPAANIEKMSKGIPLTDQDRWDWLISLRLAAMKTLSLPSSPTGVVMTCSALKQKYRDVIRIAHYNSPDVLVHFVYLHASEETLLERVAARQGHYMGANMVHSQLQSLEEPRPEETDVIAVDVSGNATEVEAEVLRRVQEALQRD